MAPVTYERASRCQPGSEKPAVDALDLQITQGEFLLLVCPGTLSENIVTPDDPGRPSA